MSPNDATAASNGWNEWSRHVLQELVRLNAEQQRLSDRMEKVLVEVSALEVKAGIWGALGGLLPAIGAILLMFLKGK
jgi:hypothetical protein